MLSINGIIWLTIEVIYWIIIARVFLSWIPINISYQIKRIIYALTDPLLDLFRKIISINGIGPQIGMALLEDLEVNQLVNAIENNESNLLTNTQGIGKRIAERLVVELKNKLQQLIEY